MAMAFKVREFAAAPHVAAGIGGAVDPGLTLRRSGRSPRGVQIYAERDVEAAVDKLLVPYSKGDKETEENWHARDVSLEQFRALLASGIAERFPETAVAQARRVVPAITNSVRREPHAGGRAMGGQQHRCRGQLGTGHGRGTPHRPTSPCPANVPRRVPTPHPLSHHAQRPAPCPESALRPALNPPCALP